MKLEIGGGTLCAEDFTNLDPAHGLGEFKRVIQDGIPCADNSVETIRASHVFEHVPAGADRINAFNEAHRVLIPGGLFEIIVPCVGFTRSDDGAPQLNGWQAWADPTHVSYWWFPNSFLYFISNQANADYGIKFWNEGSMDLVDGWEAHVVLVKP